MPDNNTAERAKRAIALGRKNCISSDHRRQRPAPWNWYNTERLHSAIGYVTPQEAEEAFYENLSAAEKSG